VSKLGKLVTLLVILALVASSFTIVNAIPEDDIFKPSTPEFTVKIVAYPYDVPPVTTTTVDQYTGKETTTTTPGYHVENKSIEITIKNPQFTPFTVTEYTPVMHYWYEGEPRTNVKCNYTAKLYYVVQVKGHFGNDWTAPQMIYPILYTSDIPAQLNSKYTVISCKADYPDEAQIDFQVKALTGFYLPFGRNVLIFGYDFYGKESDWSNTQVLTMGKIGSTAVPIGQPTSIPTQPATSTPTATSTETITPTSTPESTNYHVLTQTPTQMIEQTGVLSGLGWETTIAIMGTIIVSLVAALVLSKRNHKTQISTY
jgi:hypothetical protein